MSPHFQLHPTLAPGKEEGPAGITEPSLLRRGSDNSLQWSDNEPWDTETRILKWQIQQLQIQLEQQQPAVQFPSSSSTPMRPILMLCSLPRPQPVSPQFRSNESDQSDRSSEVSPAPIVVQRTKQHSSYHPSHLNQPGGMLQGRKRPITPELNNLTDIHIMRHIWAKVPQLCHSLTLSGTLTYHIEH